MSIAVARICSWVYSWGDFAPSDERILGVYSNPENCLPQLKRALNDNTKGGFVDVYEPDSELPSEKYRFDRETQTLKRVSAIPPRK